MPPQDPFPKFGKDDCERPACDSIQKYINMARDRKEWGDNGGGGNDDNNHNKSKKESAGPRKDTEKVNGSSSKSSTERTRSTSSPTDCPITSAELGRSSWNLLHTMAAWYPERPTAEQQARMTTFYQALAEWYPCTYCAHDFQQNLEEKPVRAESRTELCQWLCEQHNIVNEKLGKPIMPCDMKTLDKRWRKNTDPKCQRR